MADTRLCGNGRLPAPDGRERTPAIGNPEINGKSFRIAIAGPLPPQTGEREIESAGRKDEE